MADDRKNKLGQVMRPGICANCKDEFRQVKANIAPEREALGWCLPCYENAESLHMGSSTFYRSGATKRSAR